MKIKVKPDEVYAEYVKGKEYNTNQNLYDNVQQNRRFYEGDQWHGVNAPNLTKPVFNIIRRVVTYFIAMLVSDDVAVHLTPFKETPENKTMTNIVAREIDEVIERAKIKAKNRINIRNACVDGDTCMFINFNPEKDTGQMYKGEIEAEIIENTHIIFGNPYSSDVQSQPYILIIQRMYTNQVKDLAEELGLPEDEVSKIVSDDDTNVYSDSKDYQENLTTVITKYWKEKKTVQKIRDGQVEMDFVTRKPAEETITTVHMTKVTKDVVLKEPVDMEYKLYPVAYMPWETKQNSYHGQSPMTALIPNQIYINKIYAMCMVYTTNNAFPRMMYDEAKIKQLTNDVTKGIAVPNMDLVGKVMDAIKAPDFSNQTLQLIDSTINYTRDLMGASDAALGNIKPDNTSAIIAVQQASAVPLEIQRLAYYDFVEDIVRIIIDIMSCDYGTRFVKITELEAEDLGLMQPQMDPATGMPVMDEMGQPQMEPQTMMQLDFEKLKNMNYSLDVSIGQSTFWNETTQIQTMDNLFSKGIITDPLIYLEGIPDKYVPNKAKIVEKLKEAQQLQQEMAQQQAMMEAAQAAGAPAEGMPA